MFVFRVRPFYDKSLISDVISSLTFTLEDITSNFIVGCRCLTETPYCLELKVKG